MINEELMRRYRTMPRLDEEMKSRFDSGDLDAVEDALMSRLEPPVDPISIIPAIGTMVRRGHAARADVPATLLLDAVEQGDGKAVVDTCCGLLQVWPEYRRAYDLLFEHLRKAYGHVKRFNEFAAHLRALPENGGGLDRLRELERMLRYAEGTGVYVEKLGVGRVTEVNLALGKLRVSFAQREAQPTSFRLDEAERLLQRLPEGHFLLIKMDSPEELRALAKDNPGELLRRLFESVGREVPLGELKSMLEGIVDGKRWSGWWGSARKDRRLAVSPGSRPVCRWSASGSDADTGILARFGRASAGEMLDLALRHGGRSEELDRALAGGLAGRAREVCASDPREALELLLAAGRLAGEGNTENERVLEGLLRRPDVVLLVSSVRDRTSRRAATDMIRHTREDWERTYLELLLHESDRQILKQLYESLLSGEAAGDLRRSIRSVLTRPGSAPRFYLWLCREMTLRDELRPLADRDFLRGLFTALKEEGMKPFLGSLRKLFDAGGIADFAVGNLDKDEARQVLEMLERDVALEDYRAEQFRRGVMIRHPELRESEMNVFYVTPEALEAKREEFRKLVKEDIPRTAEEIKRAEEHGDLRENFEYHAARARQELFSSRAKTLSDELGRVRSLHPSAVDTSAVCVGATVRLDPVADGEAAVEVSVLGPWDSAPSRNVLSYMAPATAPLMGRRVGDRVTFNEREYVVDGIKPWTSVKHGEAGPEE